jgi:hypothetical protein
MPVRPSHLRVVRSSRSTSVATLFSTLDGAIHTDTRDDGDRHEVVGAGTLHEKVRQLLATPGGLAFLDSPACRAQGARHALLLGDVLCRNRGRRLFAG